MSYHYLQEQEAGYGQASSLDGAPFAPVKLTPAPGTSCFPDSVMVASTASPYGTTCAHSPAMSGEGESISSQVASPAKTYQLPVREQDLTATVLPFGLRWHESLARFDPATCLWKTAQPSLLEDWNGYSDRLPRWGLMHDGVLYPLPAPVLGTGGKDSGYLPTIAASDVKGRSGAGHIERHGVKRLSDALLPTPTVSDATGKNTPAYIAAHELKLRDAVAVASERLNPDWVEWLMGWPVGSTSTEPLRDAELPTWEKEPAIPRTTTVKVDKWSKRIKALGNGQVPQAMMLAWKVLQETKTP